MNPNARSRMDDAGQVHALAVPLPLQGHIRPMIQLAAKLAAAGALVSVVNLESNHESALAMINGSNNRIRLETVPDRVPVPVAKLDIFSSDENRRLFGQAHQAMEADVEELLRTKPGLKSVKCFVGDVYFGWFPALPLRMGLRAIGFSTTNASSLLVDRYIPRLLDIGVIPIPEDADGSKLVDCDLPGLPQPLTMADLPRYLSTASRDSKTNFSNRRAKAESLTKLDCLLINTSEALELTALEVLRSMVNSKTVTVGPLGLPSSGGGRTTTDDECMAWLDARPRSSVVYVSFGSLATIGARQFLELAEGLAVSCESFLWAIRPNLVNPDTDKDLAKAWETVKWCQERGVGHVIPWAPQVQVLAHPSVGGFMTHCGWNSVLETICCGESGVPILGWPQEVEQGLICCLACREWGIGTRMASSISKGEVVMRDEISAKVKEVFVDHKQKRNVATLRAAVFKAGNQVEEQLQSALHIV